jgi:hypothetical protein
MHLTTLSLLTLGSLALAAFGVGRLFLRALKVEGEDALATSVWSVGLGLAILGAVLASLCALELLYEPLMGVMALTAGFLGIGELLRAHVEISTSRPIARNHDALLEQDSSHPGWSISPRQAVWTLAVLVAGASLVLSLAPPIDGSPVAGELAEIKSRLIRHGVRAAAADTLSDPLAGMWQLWALVLDGPVAAQLVDWGCAVLLALAATLLARPIVGKVAAPMAGACTIVATLANPPWELSSSPLACLAVATLAMAALWRAVIDDDGPGWFVIAGLLFAGTVALPAMALGTLAAAVVVVAYGCARNRETAAVIRAGSTKVWTIATVFAAPWIIGHVNPAAQPTGDNAGLVERAFDHQASFPPVYIALGVMALPSLVVARRLRGLRLLLASGIASVLIAVVAGLEHSSALELAWPAAAAALAWIGCEWQRFDAAPRWIIYSTLLGTFGILATAAVQTAVEVASVACGYESRSEYLKRSAPSYPMAALANELLPRDARILSQASDALYFDRELIP